MTPRRRLPAGARAVGTGRHIGLGPSAHTHTTRAPTPTPPARCTQHARVRAPPPFASSFITPAHAIPLPTPRDSPDPPPPYTPPPNLHRTARVQGNKPATPTELAYAEAFRNLTRASAARDVTPAANTTVFLPACYRHCNTETSTWMSLKTNGFSLEQGVTSWFFGDGTVPVNNTDNCVGFNCGPGC